MRTNVRQELAQMSTEELKELRDLYYAGTWIPFNYNYVLDELEERYSESDAICGHDLDEDYGY